MRKQLAYIVLFQTAATCLWAYPSYGSRSQADKLEEQQPAPQRHDPELRPLAGRQDDPVSAISSAVTIPRVLYPTGFIGFETGPLVTSAAEYSTTIGTTGSQPDTSSLSHIPSSDSASIVPTSKPAAPSQSATTEAGDDRTTRAIAIVVPIALGTILSLAFGGALMMWCKSKPAAPDEHDSEFEVVKEAPEHGLVPAPHSN
ncbi:hypothetical protein CALCODRAFT_492870 [Calocera cornea HHB12733]|uniref:Mid2 domain-containing protein n=1 Tax=Calocera cornea HHB12733 TaxID=1353952 RepID=A0A165I3Z2_9BASI|nr:hypothetical protein CALCODRAFT_492870 [Calocera cornea HHB12733]